MEGTNKHLLLATSTLLVGFALLVPLSANAATMFLSPNSGSLLPGERFSVSVRTNTQGASVNAAEAVLRFDPARLRVESVSGDNTIFNLNVQQPDFSNSAGTVTFAGVVLNPGYTGASGNLLTIQFRARAAGQTAVTFASGAVLANDGAGTNVLTGMSGATYTISGDPTPAPTPVIIDDTEPVAQTDSLVPVVSSPTHPDQDVWYPINDVVLSWPLPNEVSGVSWLIDPKPDGNPGNITDGLVSQVSFDDVEDGETYFHVKFKRDGVFGPIAHYQLKIDTEPPEPFEIVRIKQGDPTEPQPWLLFETSDAASGIQKYVMRIGDGSWFEVPEATPERPFHMPIQAPGSHEITVKAIDGAGRATLQQLTIVIKSIPTPIITWYPENGESDGTFDVGGEAPADSTVTVRAYRVVSSGTVAERYTGNEAVALTTEFGAWETALLNLPAGVYELEAIATDARGAVSYPSERVVVTVGSWPVRLLYGVWFWFCNLPDVVRMAALAALLGILLFFIFGLRRRTRGATKRDKADDPRIETLIRDIEGELESVQRLKRSRPLYPEEKHLGQKLEVYRRELVKIGKEGVHRAEEPKKIAVAKPKRRSVAKPKAKAKPKKTVKSKK